MSYQKLLRKTFAEKEPVDPRQLEIPTGLGAPLPLRAQMIAMIRNELSEFAQARGQESFDEFDDFTDDDELPDPLTIYEAALLASENPEVFDSAVNDIAQGRPAPSTPAEPPAEAAEGPAASDEAPSA